MSAVDRIRELVHNARPDIPRDEPNIILSVAEVEALCDLADAARAVFDWEPTVQARDDFDAGYDAGRAAAADLVRAALARLDAD